MQKFENHISRSLFEKIEDHLYDFSDIHLPHPGWDDIVFHLHRKLLILDDQYMFSKLKIVNDQLCVEVINRKNPRAVEEAIRRYINNAILESNTVCISCGDSKFLIRENNQMNFFCKNCKLREDFQVELLV